MFVQLILEESFVVCHSRAHRSRSSDRRDRQVPIIAVRWYYVIVNENDVGHILNGVGIKRDFCHHADKRLSFTDERP
jgi:hypothetical protein